MSQANAGSLSLPPSARLTRSTGDLEVLEIQCPLANASIYVQGAHIANFQPIGQKEPVLFQSRKSFYQPGKPIRGGVPLIFPWFGPHRDRAELPAHGLVRTRPWTLETVRDETDGAVVIEWSARDTEDTRREWNHAYELRYRVSVGESLTMSLEVENRSSEPFEYEEALHTYLQVSDARSVWVRGLKDTHYIDKTDGMARTVEQADSIKLEGETDRIYVDTVSSCYIDDPGFARTLEIAKSGSRTTVLWNPWIRKAAAMADFGDEEWPGMICIETANAADNSLRLAPGERHTMSATIRVHPLQVPV